MIITTVAGAMVDPQPVTCEDTPMPVYSCPECDTKLKRAQPVEPGKKLRCPECDTVFKVKGEKAAAEKKPAGVAGAPSKSKFDDDDGPANYGLAQDDDTAASQKERDRAFGPLGQRFEKSKRGPALQMVVKPANLLILWGVIACICGIGTGLVATWDMIFVREVVEEKKRSIFDAEESKKTRFYQMSDDERNERLLWLAGGVAYFLWGAGVCLGASKMHEVETYWMAMTGSVMAFACPLLPLGIYFFMNAWDEKGEADQMFINFGIMCVGIGAPVAMWCISTLLKKKVKEGFADKTPVV
jgi:DNA-directed RNA polymerase subunit RPC12/RpoP